MKLAPLLALMLVPGGAVLAEDSAVDSAARGELLAATCAGCHRDESSGPRGIPSLRGLSASEIAGKLSAYRSGELQGTLMNRLARGYSEAEIRLLADALGTPADAKAATE